MEFLSGIWTYLAPFLFVLTVLVFVHEMGHYLVARWCGVAVQTFSIGFGREICHWHDSRGTRWRVGWLPLGGYVTFLGDADAASVRSTRESDPPAERGDLYFEDKPLRVRTAVVSAGPIANFLLAVVLLAGLFAVVGQPFTPPVVHEVVPDTAAAAAGFRAGDRVVEIDGRDIERFEAGLQIAAEGGVVEGLDGEGVFDQEGTGAGAVQGGEVGAAAERLAQVVGDGADVGAVAAFDVEDD